jgi:hypothetical protein
MSEVTVDGREALIESSLCEIRERVIQLFLLKGDQI